MRQFMSRFGKDQSGATAIEYALIVGLISLVAIGTLSEIGAEVKVVFDKILAQLKTVNPQ